MPLLLQPPPIIHQLVQLPLCLPLARPLLHLHPRRQDLHLQLPPRQHRLLEVLCVVLTTGALKDLLHAWRVELAADAVADVFGDRTDGLGEVVGVRSGGQGPDGVVVAELADGEFGDEGVEVPVAADEDVFACAFANDGFLLMVPDKVGHIGFFAGVRGFLRGFFAFIDVLAEAGGIEAEGAGARGGVYLMALVAEEGSFERWEESLNAVDAVRADLKVGKMVVFVSVLIFDSVPVAWRWDGARAGLVILANIG